MSFYHPYMDSLNISQTSVVTAVALILLSLIYYWIKKSGVLPGPKGVPYLGLYPFLTDENVHLKLEEYKKKYGDLFSFTYSGRLYINLGSIKAMREIILQNSDCFIDKVKDTNIINLFTDKGLLMANGEKWKIQRKFFIQKFKEYGLSAVRGDLTGPLYDSLNSAIDELKNIHGKPVNIVEFLSQHCAITMRKMLFGENNVTDQEISKMVMAYVGALEGNGGVNLLLSGPLAKLLFNVKSSFQQNIKNTNVMKKIISECVKRIESSMSEDGPTCIVEEFLKERNKRRLNNDPTWKYFSDESLIENVFHFVGDGIASVAAFIAGLFNSLLDYPEEQEKLYAEIIEVIGPNRQPTIEDRPLLSYTHAFLSECCRTMKFLVIFPGSECTRDTTVRGYKIPRGAISLYNIWSAHHDQETYEDPYTFKPSRYLQAKGKPKVDPPIMFGMGKRICTAEPIIMLQAFLFLTTIVKYFKVASSNAPNDTRMEFLIAGKLELSFVPRKES